MNESLSWRQVPGWFDFDDVYREAVDRAPSGGAHFVEVGVMCGRSALFMADAIRASGKKIVFDAVDPWAPTLDDFKRIAENLPWAAENFPWAEIVEKVCDSTKLLDVLRVSASPESPDVVSRVVDLLGLGDFVRLVRSKGQEQAFQYPVESLDFVYVDALHTYEDTQQILQAFVPKLRGGGVLAGHDYKTTYPGVDQAVSDVLGTKIETRRQSFVWTK